MPKKVKIYSTPACPYCLQTKEFLKQNNVDFEDIDVSADKQKVQEMVNISGQMAVPVLDIEGEVIVGFDKSKIQQILGV